MRTRNLLMCSAVLVMRWTGIGLADEEGTFVEGTTSVGAHYTDFSDNPLLAGEYVNLNATKDSQADMYLDLFGGTENTLFNIHLDYRDIATKKFEFGVNTKSLLSADFRYGSFVHNLDHDYMENLIAREILPGGDEGGKQIYHTDHDPLGRYSLEFQWFKGNIDVDLPFLPNGKVYGDYMNQRQQG